MLVELAVQVTVLALAGLGLTVLARRAPGAGARTALCTLAGTTVLAVIACCPLPSWWTWDVMPATAAGAAPANKGVEHDRETPSQRPNQAAKSSPSGGVGLAALLSSLRNLGRGPASAAWTDASFWGWSAVVAVVAGIGTALGLLRLMLGLLAIRRGWRRSRPVEEPGLLRLVDQLRFALGVKQPVSVREWKDLASAATVGWRMPVLLLPRDWRDWTEEQRRAVVAHELAHVARGDFAGGLLAQLSLALHFWHPLVRLLAWRFHLQRELAADATAAPLAGGRQGYLRVLAELALRSDGRAHGWPAPALLSHKGTLLRRVEMLRVQKDGENQPVSRTGRRLTIALLFGLTLTVSALRGPVQETLAEPSAGAAKQRTAPVTPFDLSLVVLEDKETGGVYGIRPAALLNRPSMAPVRLFLNDNIDQMSKAIIPAGFGIHAEDVEQLMGRVNIKGENKPGKRAVMFSLNVLRTTRDMDWVKLRDQWRPKMKQHQWKGETYVSVPLPMPLKAIIGGNDDAYLWAADARTLIFDTESAIKVQIEAKTSGRKPEAPGYAAGWNRVSTGFFAVALDNRGGRLVRRSITKVEMKEAAANPKEPDHSLYLISKNVSEVVMGFAGNDDFQCDLWATADTPAKAAAMARSCEELLEAAKKEWALEKTEDPIIENAGREMLNRAAIQRDGRVVTVHTDLASGFNTFLSEWAKGPPGSSEKPATQAK